MPWLRRTSILFVVLVLLAGCGSFSSTNACNSPASSAQRTLTRLTFDDGLQIGATWSPDGRFIAYSSDRGGKFDIWVQQISGGDPVQITKGPGHNWQPDWSPDGKYIAYRSEDGEGGLFVVPALGGEGLERRIASFGYYPRWSPDGSQILFQTYFTRSTSTGSMWLTLTEAHRARSWRISSHGTNCGRIQPRGIPTGGESPSGGGILQPAPSFWTVPLAGGVAVRSEIAPEIVRQLGEVSAGQRERIGNRYQVLLGALGESDLLRTHFSRGQKSLEDDCRSDTLQAAAIERLTTGPGYDTQLAVSADGRKLAFTGETQHIRAWLFPFDATQWPITGKGEAVTSPGMEAWRQNLSRDGKKLAFCAKRAGKWELWEKSLVDGREAPIVADDYHRNFPRVVARRHAPRVCARKAWGQWSAQFMVWSGQNRNEEPLTASSTAGKIVYDWSADGKGSWYRRTTIRDRTEVWLLPVAAAPHAEAAARRIISDPAYDVFQPHFSPDGRWIVFEAVINSPSAAESTLYIMPATGGHGLASRRASIGTTSLAGLPMARRFTSFLAAAASSMFGESTSTPPEESRLANRSV